VDRCLLSRCVLRNVAFGPILLLAAGGAVCTWAAWAHAQSSSQPVRAFMQNDLTPDPAFAPGFAAYMFEKHQAVIATAQNEALRALSAEPLYQWIYPSKYVDEFYRSVYVQGDTCTIRTHVSQAGQGLLIVRPLPNPFNECTARPPPGAFTRARPSTAHTSSDHSRYLFSVVDVTARLRDGVVEPILADLHCLLITCRRQTLAEAGPARPHEVAHDDGSRWQYTPI
jgi:hypothetical protein